MLTDPTIQLPISTASKHPVEEYKEVSANLRQYSNMRFAQMTLCFGISGGIAATLFRSDHPLENGLRQILMVVGMLVGVVFYVMERRSSTQWYVFWHRARVLESQLGYCQYLAWKEAPRPLRSSTAVTSILLGSSVLWLTALALGF